MRTHQWVAALGLACVLGTPALAQRPVDSVDSRAAAAASAGPYDVRDPGPGMFAGKGIRVAREPYLIDDGSADVREGVVGVMPVADNATLGIGVYRVGRYSRGEPSVRRLRPMEDVDGRRQKIAAVGLNIAF